VANYDAANGTIALSFAGEAMITRALKPYQESAFLGIRDTLQASDVAFANAEMLFHNYEDFPTYNSQTWMRCDPRFLEDLRWLGINLVSCANNHGFDYGENGVLTNIRNLDAVGLVHAGSGRNYSTAIAPAYLDTANGRVALVSGTTSARANSRAGEQRHDLNGRPGVNLLRWINEWRVDAAAFEQVRAMADQLGWSQKVPKWWAEAFGVSGEDSDEVAYFPDRNVHGVGSEDPVARFVRSDSFGRGSRLHEGDLARNLESVAEARRMADWVIYSIHNHEGGDDVVEPSAHVQRLAHEVIDAGADVVIGHGPHRDRGIEIYSGRPILYSLGNFIMQNDSVERLPADAMALWGLPADAPAADLFDARESGRSSSSHVGPGAVSAIVVVRFEHGSLAQIELVPIEVGADAPRPQAGRPMLSTGATAIETIKRFQEMSEPFGTQLEIEADRGLVKLS
jgi:poly-gamma-glutamate capsule biosynthesis protein CapA/YwtB (metallophosphatase superfamily)